MKLFNSLWIPIRLNIDQITTAD